MTYHEFSHGIHPIESESRDGPTSFVVAKSPSLLVIQCPNLPVVHGFFGRSGGVSLSPFDSLNGSIKKESGAPENRRRAYAFLGVTPALFPLQRHGATVLTLPEEGSALEKPADALVTCQEGLTLGVLTADCAPVMFYDARGIIAIAHVGWKGAVAGIVERTVGAMEALGATKNSILAFIGPTIRRCSYEVDPRFMLAVAKEIPTNDPLDLDPFFSHRDDRTFFDLPRYITQRLEEKVAQIVDTGHDTYGPLFFSRRYAIAQGNPDHGNSLSLLSLQPSHTPIDKM